MSVPELDGITAAKETPIVTLKHVPIEERYLSIVTRLLTKHGATLTEADEAPPPNIEDNDAKMYTATFPPGTVRANGMIIHRSVSFLLLFPDGYHLHGAELWPIGLHESDTCINVFTISSADVKK
jgi:hypothetical protein